MQGERKSVPQIDADVFSMNAQDELLRALENSRERLQVCARKLGTTDATKIFIGLSPGSVLRNTLTACGTRQRAHARTLSPSPCDGVCSCQVGQDCPKPSQQASCGLGTLVFTARIAS